jgi:hypothetical protein
VSIWFIFVFGKWPVGKIGPFCSLFEDTEEGANRRVRVFRDMCADHIRTTVFANEADYYANNINVVLKQTEYKSPPVTWFEQKKMEKDCFDKYVRIVRR